MKGEGSLREGGKGSGAVPVSSDSHLGGVDEAAEVRSESRVGVITLLGYNSGASPDAQENLAPANCQYNI
jgi:hypothetical protein